MDGSTDDVVIGGRPDRVVRSGLYGKWILDGCAPGSSRPAGTPAARGLSDRWVGRLRRHHAAATRDDQRERIYQGAIDVAWIRSWLCGPVT
ncbi:hypothetical protein [Nonomuraea sp. NPDC050540]|uniref:hypothetical protein n=1 Tax=Nonomuraea sp. NPDC050540 TaxID=3364367 RepID=UPI0037948D9A